MAERKTHIVVPSVEGAINPRPEEVDPGMAYRTMANAERRIIDRQQTRIEELKRAARDFERVAYPPSRDAPEWEVERHHELRGRLRAVLSERDDG